jgi:tetratricopeptide (TPR) repeat protein
MPRAVLYAVVLLAAFPLAAQQPLPGPLKLPRDLDTLDAEAYFEWGRRADVDWKKALEAFQWATRLEPDDSDYRHATYLALWYRQSPEWRGQYYEGARFVTASKEAQRIDSAFGEVLLRNPFPHFSQPCYFVEGLERNRDRVLVGLIHYDTGCYPQAIAALGEGLAEDSSLLNLHLYVARARFYQREYTGAIRSLQVVLDSLRARDAKYLVRWYESKAMLEYMIAVAHQAAGRRAPAREALGRALTEDLAFYMAHARLGEIAMTEGKLEEAVAEFTLARDLAPADAVMHERLGEALVQLKRHADAEAPLREAMRLEPLWIKPRYQLGLALVGLERWAETAAVFEEYIAHCPRRLGTSAAQASQYVKYARERLVGGGSP